MKKFIFVMVAIAATASATYGQVKTQKVAYINTQKVRDTLPQTDSVKVQLNKYVAELQEELATMSAELEKVKAELDKSNTDPSTPAFKKELLTKKYQSKYYDFQSMQEAAESDVIEQQRKKLEPIYVEIKKAIAEVAKLKGYTMVIDNTSGVVLYNQADADDITADVIKYMLARVPKTTPAATPAPKPAAGNGG